MYVSLSLLGFIMLDEIEREIGSLRIFPGWFREREKVGEGEAEKRIDHNNVHPGFTIRQRDFAWRERGSGGRDGTKQRESAPGFTRQRDSR